MVNTRLYGPYELTSEGVEQNVTEIYAGTYALGKINGDNGNFIVEYVGRSDSNVGARLRQWIGQGYANFKFDYFSSAKAAFEKECNIYHDFSGLDNQNHPDRPKGENWQCPRCNIFEKYF